VETGGVLAGFVDSVLNAVVITAASGPGPKAIHGRYNFNRDAEFCQRFLNRQARLTSGVIDFVGEWHKHPETDPHPSPQDIDTYRKLAANKDANVPMPVLLIIGTYPQLRRARDAYARLNAFVFSRKGFVDRDVRWLADDAYLDLLNLL
jgi:integrative and conjugative element protein (TIGR02256 family)